MDYGEEPNLQLASADIEAWRSVQSGLSLHLLAHYLYLAGVGLTFLLFILILILASSRSPGGGGGVPVVINIFSILSGLLMLCNWILAMVGISYWLLAPVRHGARAMGIACLVLTSLVLLQTASLAQVQALFLDRSGGGERPPMAMFSSAISFFILEIARLTLFPFFLRSLALNFNSPSLASMAVVLAIVTPSAFVGLTLLVFLLGLVGGAIVIIIMVILFFLGWLGILVWGVLVLMRGRNILRSQLRRAAG
jgi:hypothetical protein